MKIYLNSLQRRVWLNDGQQVIELPGIRSITINRAPTGRDEIIFDWAFGTNG